MKTLPQDIQRVFYETLKGDKSIFDFERWLYANKELEACLDAGDYLDLISLNFKKSGAKYELWQLLKKHVDPGDFEKYKMLGLLYEAKQRTDKLPHILMQFYDLYCKGYDFLQDLGLGIGLTVVSPSLNNTNANSWDELTAKQQKELLDGFSPELEMCLEKAIRWLETGQITLTGQQNDNLRFDYADLRSEEEKKSSLWVVVSENKATGFTTSENILSRKGK